MFWRKKEMWYSADFETTGEDKVRVWLWAICDVPTQSDFITGTTLTSFMKEISNRKYRDAIIYFHNLKFDGNYILYHLLTHGFTWTNKRKIKPKQFSTIIDHMGKFYEIKVNLHGRQLITFRDSLKKLPMSVKEMARIFNMDEGKGEIDYNAERPEGYQPTSEEIDYIRRDVQIVARALDMEFKQGMRKMTTSSDALAYYKTTFDKFKYHFPVLQPSTDAFCRKAYRGGWVYANPRFQGRTVGSGIVLDVNSMYPWAMVYKPLPYGNPKYYKGEYDNDDDYPLYICHITADFKLKAKGIPCIQIKNSMRFIATEYVTDTDGFVELWLTSIDLELLFTNYDIIDINFIDGYKFHSKAGMFKDYVEHFMEIKARTKGGERALAKLMMNGLSGKFAKNPDVTGKVPVYDAESDTVKLLPGEKEIGKSIYVPVTAFITAWARWNILTSAAACYDRFLYADTDSLHLLGTEIPEGIEVHESKLGCWKLESTFTSAKYLHAKCYVEQEESGLKVTVAGLPKESKKQVNMENFASGTSYTGKLIPKRVPGGVKLEETLFTIN